MESLISDEERKFMIDTKEGAKESMTEKCKLCGKYGKCDCFTERRMPPCGNWI